MVAEAGVKASAATAPMPWPDPKTQALQVLTAWTTALARTPSELSRERLVSGGRKSTPSFLSRALWSTGQTARGGKGLSRWDQAEAAESFTSPAPARVLPELLRPGVALGTLADRLSPQAGLAEGREHSSQEEDP